MPRPKDTEIQSWCEMPSDSLEPRQINQVPGLIQRRYGDTMMTAVTAHLKQKPGRNANQAITAITGNPPVWVRERRERDAVKPHAAARPPQNGEEYMRAIGLAPKPDPSDTQTATARPPMPATAAARTDDAEWLDELPEDLHKPKAGPAESQRFADTLRSHPGKWRLWKRKNTREQASSTAAKIRHGRPIAFRPAGAYDARPIENPIGTHNVYVAYTGKETEQ